jgi:hypothetical protein
MDHRVEIYYFEDGSVYVAPRKGARTDEQIIQDGLREESDSPVYQALKAGLYIGQKLVGDGYSKKEAESRAQSIVDYFRSPAIGRRVLNQKPYKV